MFNSNLAVRNLSYGKTFENWTQILKPACCTLQLSDDENVDNNVKNIEEILWNRSENL